MIKDHTHIPGIVVETLSEVVVQPARTFTQCSNSRAGGLLKLREIVGKHKKLTPEIEQKLDPSSSAILS
jgi:hypothetical protein